MCLLLGIYCMTVFAFSPNVNISRRKGEVTLSVGDVDSDITSVIAHRFLNTPSER